VNELSPHDASSALDAIESADRRVREFKGYRSASPYLLLWGMVWLLANAITDLWPPHGGIAWLVGTCGGSLLTLWLVISQAVRMQRQHQFTPQQRMAIRRRSMILGTTMMAFFPAMLLVLAPLTGKQQNAFISLFWAFARGWARACTSPVR
jgi:hypothetical protein